MDYRTSKPPVYVGFRLFTLFALFIYDKLFISSPRARLEVRILKSQVIDISNLNSNRTLHLLIIVHLFNSIIWDTIVGENLLEAKSI